MRKRGRRRAAFVVAVTLLTGTAACGGLPTDSPVIQGDMVGAPVLPPVNINVHGPMSGAAPEEIVRGFVAASISAGDDFRAAREFLTSELADRWAPRSRAAVLYVGSLTIEPTMSGQDRSLVLIKGNAVATLASDGRLTEKPAGYTPSATLTLSREAGEWRIASLPEDFGLWLAKYYFDRFYSAFNIGYPSAFDRTIIPDRRWYPATNALPTALARGMLEPVPAYLEGAVRPGFPALAKLSVDAVSVTDGVAAIDLTAAALDSTAEQRRAALAQAIYTMRQAADGVSLQVDGRPLEVVGASGSRTELPTLGYLEAGGPVNDTVVLRQGSTLTALEAAGLRDKRARPGTTLPAVEAGWTSIAISPDLNEVAAVSVDGRDLQRWHREVTEGSTTSVDSAVLPRFGDALARPAFDRYGGLWVAGADLAGLPRLWHVDTRKGMSGGVPRRVDTPWLGERRIIAIKVARDGQRVALVTRTAQGVDQVLISGVTRAADGRPTGLAVPLELGGSLVQVGDIAWVSAYQLVVIGRTAQEKAMRPLLVGLGGSIGDLAVLGEARSLATVGDLRGLLVQTSNGRIFAPAGGGWQEVASANDLVVPGG